MPDHVSSQPNIILGLGQNERALQHRLCVQRQTFRRPCGSWRVARLGSTHHFFNFYDMRLDASKTGIPDRRMGDELLLRHGAQQACGVGQCAPFQKLATKIHIADQLVQRVFKPMIRRLRKGPAGHIGPEGGCRYGQLFFARKVVKESALGHPRLCTQGIHSGAIIAILAHQLHGSSQKPAAGR